jgi:ATP-dependent helicase/nuclease subunit A
MSLDLQPAPALVLPPLPAYRLRRIVRPSAATEDAAPETALETNAEQAAEAREWRDAETARLEGVALHALLQHLGRIDPGDWQAVGAKALPVLLPGRPESHARTLAKARSILTRPELQPLFGANSRAEVPILAHGTRNGAPVLIAGRIDRVVLEPQRVLIVDYKSDAVPPSEVDGVPPGYLAQVGLYAQIAGQLFPGMTIDAAILWTSLESLMILPSAKLRQAISSFTIG